MFDNKNVFCHLLNRSIRKQTYARLSVLRRWVRRGEFGMLLQVEDVLEWLDEQGNEPVDNRFSVLGTLHEEENPVVVIVSPKSSL